MKVYPHLHFILMGLIVEAVYDDLSFEKVADQSSTSTGDLYYANNAVDRKISTCMRTKDIGQTKESSNERMWWKVDLGGVYNIYSINILFKNYDGYETRQRGRFAGFSLYVSNNGVRNGSTQCYKNGSGLPLLNFTTTCTEFGRYVIFYNERLQGVTYPIGYELDNVLIELCEVIVLGCEKPGVYGSNCDSLCPTNCKNNTCHIQHGNCYSCKPGWNGTTCSKECNNGWYGEDCRKQCTGHCRDGVFCNHVTGQCVGGCDAGWTGSLCEKECENGMYGYNCVNNCRGHCLNNSPCNKQTGHCDRGCELGYTNDDCSKKCPTGYFGMDCNQRCSRHCINKEPCDHVSGVCHGGCQDGSFGSLCNNTCKEGNYGRNCSLVCSPNCTTCRHTDGLCTCKSGWIGNNCTERCTEGWYGINCSQQCSGHCRDGTTCNHVTGQCDGRCDAGWTQFACDKECDDGTYGYDCVKNCSGHCRNDSSCEKLNGQCKNGCNPGYTSLLCNEQVLQNSSDKKDITTSTIFLLISLTINIVFIAGCSLLIWGIYTRRVSILGYNPSCWKKSENYEDTDIKTDKDSNYEELDPPREAISITYQNTTLQ